VRFVSAKNVLTKQYRGIINEVAMPVFDKLARTKKMVRRYSSWITAANFFMIGLTKNLGLLYSAG